MPSPLILMARLLGRAARANTLAKIYPAQMQYHYERKRRFAIEATAFADAAGIAWGWKANRETKGDFDRFALYFELPSGQVSFHFPERGDGPDYQGEWDGAIDGNVFDRINALLPRRLPSAECEEKLPPIA